MVNGFINVVITTIERRFGLQSRKTGFIASGENERRFCFIWSINKWRVTPRFTSTKCNLFIRRIWYRELLLPDSRFLLWRSCWGVKAEMGGMGYRCDGARFLYVLTATLPGRTLPSWKPREQRLWNTEKFNVNRVLERWEPKQRHGRPFVERLVLLCCTIIARNRWREEFDLNFHLTLIYLPSLCFRRITTLHSRSDIHRR